MISQQSCPALGEGERFVVHNVLGTGASGTVYRATDKVRGGLVAVKVLADIDPSSIFRFKAEFRTLSGIAHSNLLQLYELVHVDERWLLAMELVEGSDFLKFVRPAAAGATSATTQTESAYAYPDTEEVDVDAAGAQHVLASGTPSIAALPQADVDYARLHAALRQLSEGLRTLHRAGRVHRDLKPANVLVFDATGRLVICDFGLALELGSHARAVRGDYQADISEAVANSNGNVAIEGTLPYMPPEQAVGLPVTEASDWYAVGAMLYHAITGVTPFDASLPYRASVAAKILDTPTHPSQLAPAVPTQLADLVMAMLLPVPAFRPGYREVMHYLSAHADAAHESPRRPSAPDTKRRKLVGRDRERTALQNALARVRYEGAMLTFVSGRSGMGKSALVESFLEEAELSSCLILSGRCYEREDVPYKTFDPIVDALSTCLMQLDHQAVSRMLPPGTKSLRRIFPTLDRVPAVRDFEGADLGVQDAFDVRRDAFAALREILRLLAQSRPLLIYIDDLQWGDLDSAPIFVELLRQPAAPAVLLLCAYREEDRELSPLLSLLRGRYLSDAGIVPADVIELQHLNTADSQALALSLLTNARYPEAAAAQIALEAQGVPFFVEELAGHVCASESGSMAGIRLDTVIGARLDALPEECQRLIAIIAVAGRPEPLALIQSAAGMDGAIASALRYLEAERLVRCHGSVTSPRVEAYHDQIRDAAYRRLPADERRALHARLAEVMELSGPEPEALLRHFGAAGDASRAAEYAIQAAARADQSLAYDRASALYEQALALLPNQDPRRRGLLEQRAFALMYGGRGVQAAEALFGAIDGAPPARAAELRGLAITQLFRAGQLDAAFKELGRAQHVLGLRVPRSDGEALRMLLWRRLLLSLQRTHSVQSARLDAAANDGRMSTLWAVGAALSGVDLVRGGLYQTELVRQARKSGDPYHLACALSLSTTTLAAEGGASGRIDWLYERALEMAGISGNVHAHSVVKGTFGVSRMLQGRFLEAIRLTRESQVLLRDRLNASLAWDRVTMVFFDLQSTAVVGNLGELVQRVPEALRDAEARGDLMAATLFRSFRCSWANLTVDNPGLAREQAERAQSQWQQAGYSLQHYYVSHALCETALYTGSELDAAWERLQNEWQPSFLIRKIQHARIELTWLRARVALALAAQRSNSDALYTSAQRDARALQAEGVPWALALGRLSEAGVVRRAQPELALRLLAEAAGLFDVADMRLLAAAARAATNIARGQGRDAAAHPEVASFGMLRPAQFLRMLAPGF